MLHAQQPGIEKKRKVRKLFRAETIASKNMEQRYIITKYH